MPKQLLPKMPKIMKRLKEKGFTAEVPIENLRHEIMIVTETITESSMRNFIMKLEELGFIKISPEPGRFIILKTDFEEVPAHKPEIKEEEKLSPEEEDKRIKEILKAKQKLEETK